MDKQLQAGLAAWIRHASYGLAIGICGLATSPATAQFRVENDPSVNRILMLAPREYQQQLKQAEDAIAREQYSEAIQSLANLLEPADPARPDETPGVGEDFFIGHPSDVHLRSSLRGEARRLLGTLPARGRELYRLQYGATAERLLREALENHDVQRLEEVSWRYFHTEAGYRACLLLGRHQLDLARPLAASLCFARLAAIPEAVNQFDPELTLLLALSWHRAGLTERAGEALSELRQRRPDAQVALAGQSIPLFAANESPLAWLERNLGPLEQLTTQLTNEWLMHRGVPSRNPATHGSRPLVRHRWQVPLANNPDDEELIESALLDFREERTAPIPGVVPLVVDDVILLRTSEHMLAVDFETGKRIWEYPWAEPTSAFLTDEAIPARNRQQRRLQLEERLWLDAIYGQLASDGKNVFLVDELSYVSAGSLPAAAQLVRNLTLNDPSQPKDSNYLLALEVGTQGKYRWRVGGPTGEDEPALAGAFFLSVPLVLSGELFVMAEVRGDISLYVLESETGKLRWSQQLAHVGPLNIVSDNLRRLAGAAPSYSDGVLVCPTSAGAIVAFDLPTRSLLWGFQYPRNLISPTQSLRINFNGVYGATQATLRDRWIDASAIIDEGRVVVTPVETNQLICLDLLTGEMQWTIDRENELTYVGCLYQGRAIVVGKSVVRALNLSDGKLAWETSLLPDDSVATAEELTSGRGFRSGQFFYLPTTARLLKVDLDNGQIVSTQTTQEPLGNLISYQDQVISLSPIGLSTYYQAERLAERVAAQLRESKSDPWALEHQGLLALERGDLVVALTALRDAYRNYDEDDDRRVATRALLVDTLLALLEADVDLSGERIAEIQQLIDRPLQRERFLRLIGRQLLAQGRADEAFRAFLELAQQQRYASSISAFETPRLPLVENRNRTHFVRRDRFVRAGIRASLEQANASQRAAMEVAIEQELASALQSDRVASLTDFLRVFADHPLSDRVRLELARRYVAMDKLLEAEQLVSPLAMRATGPLTGQAWAVLARIMQRAGRSDAMFDCLGPLRNEFASQDVGDGRTGSELAAELNPSSAADGSSPWPYGRVLVNKMQVSPGNLPRQFQAYANYRPVQLREHVGPLRPYLQVAYDSTGTNSLMVADDLGREQIRLPGTSGRSRLFTDGTLTCKTLGHLIVVNYGHGLMAASALQAPNGQEQRVLWPENYQDLLNAANSRRTSMQAVPEANEWGQQRLKITGRRVDSIGPVSFDGLVYQQGNSLHCVEPITGNALWVRHDIANDAILWGDDQYVFVTTPGAETARVFRFLDGEELAARPVPPSGRHLAHLGRLVLTWDEIGAVDPKSPSRPNVWRLRLVDPWDLRDRWQRDFAAGSRADLTVSGLLAIVAPDGQLTILDVENGAALMTAGLEPVDRPLLNVYLLASRDQFLLVRNFEPRAKQGATVESFPDPQIAPLIDGDVMAFDRVSGQPQWQTPAVIEGYGLPLDQPREVPVLAFVRQVSRTDNRSRRRLELGLLCIDKRDGRLIVEFDGLNSTYGSFFMSGDPASKTVSLRLLNIHNYQLTFSDEPQPPAPTAQTGTAASHRAGSGLSGILGAIYGAIGRQFNAELGNGPAGEPGGATDPAGTTPAGEQAKAGEKAPAADPAPGGEEARPRAAPPPNPPADPPRR